VKIPRFSSAIPGARAAGFRSDDPVTPRATRMRKAGSFIADMPIKRVVTRAMRRGGFFRFGNINRRAITQLRVTAISDRFQNFFYGYVASVEERSSAPFCGLLEP